MTEEEFKKVVSTYCSWVGGYRVATAVAEVFKEVSDEYLRYGNDQAIIHKDAAAMLRAVDEMKASHPLRAGD